MLTGPGFSRLRAPGKQAQADNSPHPPGSHSPLAFFDAPVRF